ncbi:MAG: hypothetical protein M3O88_07135 [Actinomycetota bacterium]|nr:hypothetical protein [Actinomycetota bacterium]
MGTRAGASPTSTRGAGARIALLAAAVLVAVATWLILDRRSVAAGGLVLAASVLLVIGAALARRVEEVLPRVLDSVVDRGFDGGLLSSIAWVERTSDPAASAGALVALAAGFLGSYVRARGTSLGYGVEESPVTRVFRYGLVSAGLLSGRTTEAVWAVAGLGTVSALVRATQVAKEERA